MRIIRLTLATIALICLAHLSNAQTIGPCQIFPQNNPWNQRIDTLPVHWNSQKYINSVGGTIHLHPDFGSNAAYGIPWEAVSGSQKFVPIVNTAYPDESDPGPMPIPDNARVEQPPPPGGDAHVLVVDTGNCTLYELYQGIKTANGWSASCSAIFDFSKNAYRPDGWTSCDAAGLPIFPGLVKMYECQSGEIKHAIRFTVPRSQAGWIFPARHKASSITDTTYMPMGLRLRLKKSFDDSKYTGYAKVIATAMKRYGIIMADNGSAWFISGETNTSWPDNDISQLKSITGNDFEAVYTGPVATHANQYPTPTFGGLDIPDIYRDTIVGTNANFLQFRVSNSGSEALRIDSVRMKNGKRFEASLAYPQTIPKDSTKYLTFGLFIPSGGLYGDTAVFYTNDPLNPVKSVPMFVYVRAGKFFVSTLPFNFGSTQAPEVKSLIIYNRGDADLTVSAPFSIADTDFALIGGTFPFRSTIKPSDSAIMSIRFSPTKIGLDTTTLFLLITDIVGLSRDTAVLLSGTGIPLLVKEKSSGTLGVTLGPNPCRTSFLINLIGAAKAQIDVCDERGLVELHQFIHAGENSIDVTSLSSGHYYLRISDRDQILNKALEIIR